MFGFTYWQQYANQLTMNASKVPFDWLMRLAGQEFEQLGLFHIISTVSKFVNLQLFPGVSQKQLLKYIFKFLNE